MSLLAAMAKGLGVGTLDNAKVGFAEQQRQREAEQRKAEQSAEWELRGGYLDKQLQANREENKRNIDAQREDMNAKFKFQAEQNRQALEQERALFGMKLSAATSDALASSNAKYREANAKNLIGTFDALAKRRSDIMANDKITDEQRAIAIGDIDHLGYTIAADKGAQALLSEFGGAGHAQYWLSLEPPPPTAKPGANTQGGVGSLTAPPKQTAIPESLRRIPDPIVPMRRNYGDARDGVNVQASSAFSAPALGGVIGQAQKDAQKLISEMKRIGIYQDDAMSLNPGMSPFSGRD